MCFAVAAAVIPGRTFSVCGAFSVVGPKLHVHVSCFVPKPKPERCIMRTPQSSREHSTLGEQLFPLCNCLAPFSLRPPSDEMNVVGFMLVVHYFRKAFLFFFWAKVVDVDVWLPPKWVMCAIHKITHNYRFFQAK